jgi:hydrogenase expression/formation protein HypC
MCVGIPMQVRELGLCQALCVDAAGATRWIDTLLVGDPEPGDWLLVFIDAAREVISEARAMQVRDALAAVELAMRGETAVDHLFADLIEREPQLPDFLKPAAKPTGE